MSGSTSFRLEFLLPGLATLISAMWVVAAVGHLVGANPIEALMFHEPDFRVTPAWAVLIGLVVAGLTYIVGVLIVFVTYRLIARPFQIDAQTTRIEQLRSLASLKGREAVTHSIFSKDQESNRAQATPLLRALLMRTGPHIGLALSAGRDNAGEGVVSEFEYRRYLRQISAGVFPGVLIATASGALTDWETFGAAAPFAWALRIAILTVGLMIALEVLVTARYQEQVGQALLIDSAFLYSLNRASDSAGDRNPDNRTGTVDGVTQLGDTSSDEPV